MCGIAGAVNIRLDVERLKSDLWHRGPDEHDTFYDDNVQLHHQRLSIVDITCGKQPMEYANLVIAFNGEIYNHIELRNYFNLQCRTNSDTETLLHLYKKLGAGFLDHVDGMFAIAIFDRESKQVFFARDRAGKKPLYYHHAGSVLVFASELNALKNQIAAEIADAHICQFLRLGFFHGETTPFKNIKEFPAGSFGVFDIQQCTLNITRWWNIHDHYLRHSDHDFETALETTDAILHRSIKRRISSSDLEVGCFLSGGIDSGLVTAISKQYSPELKTFTVSFPGAYDEAPLARLVADKYGTSHHELRVSFDNLENDIENILGNYGEPFFDSSAIPSYYVSKAAKEHLTVILNGDGGDEIFGGYRRYVPFNQFNFFETPSILRKSAALIERLLPVADEKRSLYNFIYRLIQITSKENLEMYLSATTDCFEGYEDNLKCNHFAVEGINKEMERICSANLTALQKIMNIDFDFILTGNLLVKMDIATMAHAVEGRSPFLCKELLEYVPGLPDEFKIKGKTTKILLRKLAEKYLPAPLVHQPKRGFEIPLKNWVNCQLREMIGDYINSPTSYSNHFFKKGFARKLFDKEIRVGEEKRAKMLWTMFALNVWYSKLAINGSKLPLAHSAGVI